MEASVPYLLARYNDLPFPEDFTHYTDHDLVSNFRNDAVHQILLDVEELRTGNPDGPGNWYIAVLNSEESTGPLSYSITAEFSDDLDCPVDQTTGLQCAGNPCIRSLGRCDCPTGLTLDDCR